MSRTFNRRKGVLRVQPQMLVICEDSKSSKNYLEDAAKFFRSYAKVEIAHSGKTDPLSIVTIAIERAKNFDHVYCAIDRDNHPNFAQALNVVSGHKTKVTVIASYPCYEFWLYLHFHHSRKPYAIQGNLSAGDCMVKDLCKFPEMSDYDKGNSRGVFETLLPKLQDAINNAKLVFAAAAQDGNLNPSTQLHELINVFEELGTPKLVK